MSRSFSFKQSIWQVNPGSQCQKTACRKEAFGNTLHYHMFSFKSMAHTCIYMEAYITSVHALVHLFGAMIFVEISLFNTD